MLIRAGGGDFRKLSIPRDTLAEHPRPGGEQDQLRLRDRRRQADGSHDRELPRHQRRPGGDHRLRRLPQVHRLDRRRRGQRADGRLLQRLGRRLQPASWRRASTRSTASRRSRWPAPARTTCATDQDSSRSSSDHRHQPGPVPAGDPRRDQGPAHQTRCGCPTTSSRARSSAGTRRRRWSRAWARWTMPQLVVRRGDRRQQAPTS